MPLSFRNVLLYLWFISCIKVYLDTNFAAPSFLLISIFMMYLFLLNLYMSLPIYRLLLFKIHSDNLLFGFLGHLYLMWLMLFEFKWNILLIVFYLSHLFCFLFWTLFLPSFGLNICYDSLLSLLIAFRDTFFIFFLVGVLWDFLDSNYTY